MEHQASEDVREDVGTDDLRVVIECFLEPTRRMLAKGVERMQDTHEDGSGFAPFHGLRAVADLAGDGQRAYAAFCGVVLDRCARQALRLVGGC